MSRPVLDTWYTLFFSRSAKKIKDLTASNCSYFSDERLIHMEFRGDYYSTDTESWYIVIDHQVIPDSLYRKIDDGYDVVDKNKKNHMIALVRELNGLEVAQLAADLFNEIIYLRKRIKN